MDAVPGSGGSGALLGGRYEIGPLVGLGGTARVHSARDRVEDITVAVKIFPMGSAAGPGGDGSRELAVLSRMQHPGLVGVRDSGVDDEGHPFVVMDFVDGKSLAARLREGTMTAPATARVGAVLADALAHVHGHGVVHRDVKPGNVLLDGKGNPLLSDFGIARLIDATRVTATGLVVGTAAFMAPEQVRGEIVGPPADIYALGLVLLEAVTGRREFEGGALESAIARLHRSPVVPADVPEPLASTIRRMTAAEPAERPTASEVAAALRAHPVERRRLDGALTRRLVSAGALASLAASVVAGVVLLSGADTSPGASAAPAVAPAPELVAAPPVDASTTTEAADPPVAVASTTQRPAPVPVALSKRARPVTVTRTVTRAPAVADEKDESTGKKDKDKSEDKKSKDKKSKDEDDKDKKGAAPKKDPVTGDNGDDGGKDDSGKGSSNSGKGNGKGNGNSGKGKSGDD